MPDVNVLDLVPAAVYLAVLGGLLLSVRRCPMPVHLTAVVLGVGVRVVQDGPLWAGASLLGSALVFLALLSLASRLITKVTLLSVTVTLALLPLLGWPLVGVALLVAAVVGAVRTARVAGVARLNLLTNETFAAMGVTGSGFAKPDLSRLPTAADSQFSVTDAVSARRMRLYLTPYLLGAVVVGMAVFALV